MSSSSGDYGSSDYGSADYGGMAGTGGTGGMATHTVFTTTAERRGTGDASTAKRIDPDRSTAKPR